MRTKKRKSVFCSPSSSVNHSKFGLRSRYGIVFFIGTSMSVVNLGATCALLSLLFL